jgi:hypothetical protein
MKLVHLMFISEIIEPAQPDLTAYSLRLFLKDPKSTQTQDLN